MHGITKNIFPAVGGPDNRSSFFQVVVADIIVWRDKYFIVFQKYLQYMKNFSKFHENILKETT